MYKTVCSFTGGRYFWTWQKAPWCVWFQCCLISRDQRVTYGRTVLVYVEIHISTFQNFSTLLSVRDTEKMALLAFEGHSVAADGHDGVVHIVVSLQRRVDVHHLKVHRNTAEPAKQDRQPTIMRYHPISLVVVGNLSTVLCHHVQTWTPLWRGWAAQGRCHRRVWASQCVCLHTLQEEAATWDFILDHQVQSSTTQLFNSNQSRGQHRVVVTQHLVNSLNKIHFELLYFNYYFFKCVIESFSVCQ